MEENNNLENNQNTTVPVSLEKPVRPQGNAAAPVSLEKPVQPQQPGYGGQPVNSNGQQPGCGGQPVNYYGQPNYQYQQVPPQPRKKKKTGLIIGIAVAVLLVLLIVPCFLITRMILGRKGPEYQVRQGMANMAEEMEAYTCSISEDLGLEAFNKLKSTKPVHTDIDLSFTSSAMPGGLDNIGIGVDAVTDRRNEKAKYDISVGTYGFNMEVGSIVAAGNTLYFTVPLVFEDEAYSVELTHLGRDFNRSAWSDLLDTKLPEDSSYTLFEYSDTMDELREADMDAELAELLMKYNVMVEGASQYRTISEKKAFQIGGKTVNCSGVRLTVEKDAYNDMLRSLRKDILSSDFYADFLTGYLTGNTSYAGDIDDLREEADQMVGSILSMRLKQDYVLDFYLDGRGRIVNISTPADIAVSSKELDVDALFAVDISFTGVERTLDEIEGGIYVKAGSQVAYLGISRQASVTDKIYREDISLTLQDDSHTNDILFQYQNDWSYVDKTYDMQISVDTGTDFMKLEADGGYEDIVKGEGFTFRINQATLYMDDSDSLILSGTIAFELADEKIETPRNATNLLEMSEWEIQNMMYTIYGAMSLIGY